MSEFCVSNTFAVSYPLYHTISYSVIFIYRYRISDTIKVINMFGSKRRDLRTWILFTLNSGPKNGAEIMDSIEKQMMGVWRPSPGSMYPMLENMVNEGLIKKLENGKYEPLEENNWLRAGLFGHHGSSPRNFSEAVSDIEGIVTYMEELRSNGSKQSEDFSERLKEVSKRLDKLSQ